MKNGLLTYTTRAVNYDRRRSMRQATGFKDSGFEAFNGLKRLPKGQERSKQEKLEERDRA